MFDKFQNFQKRSCYPANFLMYSYCKIDECYEHVSHSLLASKAVSLVSQYLECASPNNYLVSVPGIFFVSLLILNCCQVQSKFDINIDLKRKEVPKFRNLITHQHLAQGGPMPKLSSLMEYFLLFPSFLQKYPFSFICRMFPSNL